MPNIGNTLAKKLNLVGIETPTQLIETGTENAFIRLIQIDKNACYNMLYAIEGAIQGIRWHNLNTIRKLELKNFFDSIQNSQKKLNHVKGQ